MIYHYHDTPIYYTLHGNGKPLVLIHGFLESNTMWRHFIPELVTQYQVLILDLPGHGKSGNLSKTHTMEAMADVVFSLLDFLKWESIKLVGHSMGGYIGLAMLEKAPQRIDEFILLNSTTYIDNNSRKENRERAIAFFETQKETIISMAIANLFTPTEHTQFKTEIKQLKEEAYTFSAKGLVSCIIGMRDRKERTHVLKNFNKKATIVAGTKDPIAPIQELRNQAKTTAKPLFEIESGHMSWMTHPKEIVHFIE